ncbi:MAG TPA: hypothetical protein VK498_05020 [Ferruginibacter sp.]|nr:hypothetical protein [Ferruginibacter sp.]
MTQFTLLDKDIIVDRGAFTNLGLSEKVKSKKLDQANDDSDTNDGSDIGTTDSFTKPFKFKSAYTIVNGEGSDGDTDGSESDGDDKRI